DPGHPARIETRDRLYPRDLGFGPFGGGEPVGGDAQLGQRALDADAASMRERGQEHVAGNAAAQRLHAQRRPEPHVAQSGFDVVRHPCQYAAHERGSQWISPSTASPPPTARASMPATTPPTPSTACPSSACTG